MKHNLTRAQRLQAKWRSRRNIDQQLDTFVYTLSNYPYQEQNATNNV